MTITARQWVVLLVLIVGFAVAALLVARSNDELPPIDEEAWCTAAADLSGVDAIVSGTADDVEIADVTALLDALDASEEISPYAVRADIARLSDFVLVLGQSLAVTPWPDAHGVALDQTDGDAVEAARAGLQVELEKCGDQA